MADDKLAAGRACERDGEIVDTYGGEHYWQCGQPGALDVEGRWLCEDHAGELGYGPKQEEYGFDPDDGLNPTPAVSSDGQLAAEMAPIRERAASVLDPEVMNLVRTYRAAESARDVPRLLAALDAVLALHRSRPAFGRLVCGHDTDAGGGTLLVTWPCQTYEAILTALTGERGDSG